MSARPRPSGQPARPPLTALQTAVLAAALMDVPLLYATDKLEDGRRVVTIKLADTDPGTPPAELTEACAQFWAAANGSNPDDIENGPDAPVAPDPSR